MPTPNDSTEQRIDNRIARNYTLTQLSEKMDRAKYNCDDRSFSYWETLMKLRVVQLLSWE